MTDTSEINENLVEEFKRDYGEQFYVLVKMHLSFVLDLHVTNENGRNSDEKSSKVKKWNLVPCNKSKNSKNPKRITVTEGAPLTQEGICQVYQLIEFLKREQNIKIEGIFRRTGSLARQQELRNFLNQGATVDLENCSYSVHDCASVLKTFLSELPDPLITDGYYSAFYQISELYSEATSNVNQKANKVLVALQLLFLLLPAENKILLKDVLNLLNHTASFQSSNKMSASNLSKLFTPHLICPRNMTPEEMHTNCKMLCDTVTFLINKSDELFKIPHCLIVDFKAKLESRKLNVSNKINESQNDQDAANTVYSFTDKARTQKENEYNTTETALAQLYAHIQSLPESSKKRKLVKQFNKENGQGTPLQVMRSSMPKNKGFSESIKRRIFYKSLAKTVKNTNLSANENFLQENSSQKMASQRKECNLKNDSKLNDEVPTQNKQHTKRSTESSSEQVNSVKMMRLNTEIMNDSNSQKTSCLSSTPSCISMTTYEFTPDKERTSVSPISKSTQQMPKTMQESMMTPRSRKPVLLVSRTNITNSLSVCIEHNTKSIEMDNINEPEKAIRKSSEDITSQSQCLDEIDQSGDSDNSLTATFREYLYTRNIIPDTALPHKSTSLLCGTENCIHTDINSAINNDEMSKSLMQCLNGEQPNYESPEGCEKKLTLKPREFNEHGQPIIFETSF